MCKYLPDPLGRPMDPPRPFGFRRCRFRPIRCAGAVFAVAFALAGQCIGVLDGGLTVPRGDRAGGGGGCRVPGAGGESLGL